MARLLDAADRLLEQEMALAITPSQEQLAEIRRREFVRVTCGDWVVVAPSSLNTGSTNL